jgi:hypothetical protein
MRTPPKSPMSYGKRSLGHTMNMKLRGTPSLVDICATTAGVKLPCTKTKSITICSPFARESTPASLSSWSGSISRAEGLRLPRSPQGEVAQGAETASKTAQDRACQAKETLGKQRSTTRRLSARARITGSFRSSYMYTTLTHFASSFAWMYAIALVRTCECWGVASISTSPSRACMHLLCAQA